MESRGPVGVVEDLVTVKLEIQGLLEIPHMRKALGADVVNPYEELKMKKNYVDIQEIRTTSNTVNLFQQTLQLQTYCILTRLLEWVHRMKRLVPDEQYEIQKHTHDASLQ